MRTYKVRINTSSFQSKKRKDDVLQTYDELCLKLNGKEWEYTTQEGVIRRLKKLAGLSENMGYVEIKGKKVREGLPGFCTGYIDIGKILKQLDSYKRVRIYFMNFYEKESKIEGLDMSKCYVEVMSYDS